MMLLSILFVVFLAFLNVTAATVMIAMVLVPLPAIMVPGSANVTITLTDYAEKLLAALEHAVGMTIHELDTFTEAFEQEERLVAQAV